MSDSFMPFDGDCPRALLPRKANDGDKVYDGLDSDNEGEEVVDARDPTWEPRDNDLVVFGSDPESEEDEDSDSESDGEDTKSKPKPVSLSTVSLSKVYKSAQMSGKLIGPKRPVAKPAGGIVAAASPKPKPTSFRRQDVPSREGEGEEGLSILHDELLWSARKLSDASTGPKMIMRWSLVRTVGNPLYDKELAEHSVKALSDRVSALKRALKGKGPFANNATVLALLAKHGFEAPGEDAPLEPFDEEGTL